MGSNQNDRIEYCIPQTLEKFGSGFELFTLDPLSLNCSVSDFILWVQICPCKTHTHSITYLIYSGNLITVTSNYLICSTTYCTQLICSTAYYRRAKPGCKPCRCKIP